MERKQFYTNLKLFLKDLVIVFPEDDEDLQLVTTSLNLAIIDDTDNEIIFSFYGSLNTLEHEIIERDISIFSKDPAAYWDLDSYQYKLFTKLNDNWKTFTDENQKTIWDYIQVLYGLSKQFTLKDI